MSPRITHVPITAATTTTTTTEATTSSSTTTTATMPSKTEEIAIISSTEPTEITTELFKHTNEMIISSTVSTTPMIEESNQTNVPSPTSTSTPSTMIYFEETTLVAERNTTEFQLDDTTINQANNEEQTTIVSINKHEESSTETMASNQTRLFHLLATLTERPVLEISNSTTTTTTESTTITTTASSNPCTLENLRANFVYHEYPLDKHKFIFCDSEGKMNIIACSPNYIWSQNEQSCILPS